MSAAISRRRSLMLNVLARVSFRHLASMDLASLNSFVQPLRSLSKNAAPCLILSSARFSARSERPVRRACANASSSPAPPAMLSQSPPPSCDDHWESASEAVSYKDAAGVHERCVTEPVTLGRDDVPRSDGSALWGGSAGAAVSCCRSLAIGSRPGLETNLLAW